MRAIAYFSAAVLSIGFGPVRLFLTDRASAEDSLTTGAVFIRTWPHVSERMLDTTVELSFSAQMLSSTPETVSATTAALDELASIELTHNTEEPDQIDETLRKLRSRLFQEPKVTEVKHERGVRYVGLPSLLANGTVRVENWASAGAFEALRQPTPSDAGWERHIIVGPEYCAIFLPTLRSLEVHSAGKVGASYAASEILRPIPMGLRFDGGLSHYQLTSTGVLNPTNAKVIQVCALGLPRKWGYADKSGKMLHATDPGFAISGAATYAVWRGAQTVFPLAVLHVERVAESQLYVRLVRITSVRSRTHGERPPVILPANTIAVDYSVHPPVRYTRTDTVSQLPQWSTLAWINEISVDPSYRPVHATPPSPPALPAQDPAAPRGWPRVAWWAIGGAGLFILALVRFRFLRRA